MEAAPILRANRYQEAAILAGLRDRADRPRRSGLVDRGHTKPEEPPRPRENVAGRAGALRRPRPGSTGRHQKRIHGAAQWACWVINTTIVMGMDMGLTANPRPHIPRGAPRAG